MRKISALLAFICCMALAAGDIFTVERAADGSFSVKHRGQLLLQNITALLGAGQDKLPLKEDYKVLADGSKVWNIWCEDFEASYRMEIVQLGNGKSVEISMLGEAPAWPKYSKRQITMQMPMEQFKNAPFKGVVGLSRFGHIYKAGVFNDALDKGALLNQQWRFLAIDGGKDKQILFDFDPIGPTNSSPSYTTGVIYGMGRLNNNGSYLDITCGSDTKTHGGLTGTKLVLSEGVSNDFNKIHVLPSWNYNQHIAPIFYDSFGAVKTGKFCKHLDLAKFDSQAQRGWISGKNLRKVTGSEGVFYSHVAGEDGLLKYNLPGKGLYIFCLHMGNSNHTANRFDVSINNQKYAEGLSVPAGKIAQINIPVWLDKPVAEIKFDGRFILSSVSVQYFISEKEDYSFNRAFWFTSGFEPASAFRSADYKQPLKLDASIKIITLPVPGKETARAPKTMPRRVNKADMSSEKMAWSNNIKMQTVNNTRGSLREYNDPSRMQRLIEEAKTRGTNVFMISGVHGRHGFPGRLQQHAEDLKIFAEGAHKANIKVIDHHDATYMENWEQGLRVMAERSGEMAVCVNDFAPTPQFCLSNKDFTRTYRKYLKNILKVSQIDGFQIDELYYYRHGCLCFSCREEFEKATNWQLPMNEFDSRLTNRKSDLWKMWFTWRKINMADWWIGLREEVKDVAPDMILSLYCTHREQLQSLADMNYPFDLLEQARGIAIYGSEVMPRNPYYTARSLMFYRKIYNMFCIGYNTPPIWAWYYARTWDVYYFCWAVSNMLQQSCMNEGVYEKPADGADFLAFGGGNENPANTSMIHAAQAAIYYHPDSRDYNTGISYESEVGSFGQLFEGCNIPYDIIEPRAFHNKKILNKYKVLFAVSASCLNDDDVRVLKNFAANGGTVILTTVSGLNDRWGNKRKTWAFYDVFGFMPQPHFNKLASINMPGKEAVALDQNESKHYYSYCRIQGNVNGEILLEGTPLDGGDKVPLIIGKKYKKGKFYYCSSAIHAAFMTHEFQPGGPYTERFNKSLEAFFQDLFSTMAASARIWEVKAPRLVYSELYYNKAGGYIAHFLNATGTENLDYKEIVPSGIKGEAWPSIKEDIVFTIKDGNLQSAYAVSPDFAGRKALKVEKINNNTRVTLPKELFKAYTVIYVN